MTWLLQNLGTILVLAVLAVVCALIVCKMIRDKKSGKSPTCGCGCGGCAMSGICHDPNENNKKTK